MKKIRQQETTSSSFNKTKFLFPLLLLSLALVFTVGVEDVSANGGIDTIYVNDSGGNDLWDGSTWATAKKTIDNATTQVKANGTVNIADGVYSGTGNTNITITKNMIINGQSQTGTIIDGGGNNWIFHIPYGINVIINSLTLTNATEGDGGAIYNYGNLTVTDSTFRSNHATNDGGAITNAGTLTVTRSTFNSNSASNAGAIYNDAGTLNVTESTFSNNTATNRGTIFNRQGTLTVTGSTFTSNTANEGGAISNLGTLTVTGSYFDNNTASLRGGAIINSITLTVTDSTFTGNHANAGGAIFNWETANVHFNRIVGNTATLYGSAICAPYPMNATDNWWGSNSPDFASLIYVDWESEVFYSPWLYLTFTALPTSIPQGSTSTLTASFNQHTNGSTITTIDPVNGHIPDGSPVKFTTTLGNVGSKSVDKITIDGIATAILRADEAAGDAIASVIADNQPLHTIITITPFVNAASTTATTGKTVGMQTTGVPIAPLAIGILSVLGGLRALRKKQ